MKKQLNFIVFKWNSLLLVLSTLWLASMYLRINFEFLAIAALVFSVVKLIGIITNHTGMRVTGLIGMNAVWAVTTYYVMRFSGASWQYPAIILMVGFGISLQERFKIE